MLCPPHSPGKPFPLKDQVLPLLEGNSADTEGHHLCLPTAFHIHVDIGQLINLFNGRLGGGVQGDNHEVLDSWGTGKRQRSHTFPDNVPGTPLKANRLASQKAWTVSSGSPRFPRLQPVAEI